MASSRKAQDLRKALSQTGKVQRDSAITKQSILDAAEREFASYGLAGARTEVIAADTGVTKAMIHHYFGTKEGLYDAVVERIINRMVEIVSTVPVEQMPVEEAIRSVIHKLMDEQIYPHYPGVMVNESLQNKGKYFKQHGGLRLHWTLSSIVKRGIAEGVFRQVSPEAAALSILGAVGHLFPMRYNLAQIFPGTNPDSKELQRSYLEQALDIVLAGLKA